MLHGLAGDVMERLEQEVRQAVIQKLESLERAGVTHLKKGTTKAGTLKGARKAAASTATPARPAQEPLLRPELPSTALDRQAKAPVVAVSAKTAVQPVVVPQRDRS